MDPDIGGNDGMTFVWYCKDVDDAYFNIESLANEPLVSENDVVRTSLPDAVSNMFNKTLI